MKDPIISLTSWSGAQYLDWWIVIHFLAGVSMSYVCRMMEFSLLITFIIVGTILIGWEIYEERAKIPEAWTNTILDLMIGCIGIWVAYHIIFFENLIQNFLLASTFFLIWGGLGAWGWVAWRAGEAARASVVQIGTEEPLAVVERQDDVMREI